MVYQHYSILHFSPNGLIAIPSALRRAVFLVLLVKGILVTPKTSSRMYIRTVRDGAATRTCHLVSRIAPRGFVWSGLDVWYPVL